MMRSMTATASTGYCPAADSADSITASTRPCWTWRYRKPRWNKTRTSYVGTVPGAILPSGRLSAPLEYARGAFFNVAAPPLSLGDALGQLLAAAAYIRAAAPDRDRPGAPGRAGPRQPGAVPSGGTLLNANRKSWTARLWSHVAQD